MEAIIQSQWREPGGGSAGAAERPHAVAQRIELAELRPPAERSEQSTLQGLQVPLRSVRVQVRVCLGETTMTVGQLMDARSGDLLRMGHDVERPVDLVLDGRVVARGELMAIDDQFALRITEVPSSAAP